MDWGNGNGGGQDIVWASSAPPAEAMAGSAGAAATAARGDHFHPRITSAHVTALDATGAYTLTFTRLFDTEPVNNQPIILKVASYNLDGGGKWAGANMQAYRMRPIPTNIVTLLLGGIYNLFVNSDVTMVGVTAYATFLPRS